MPKVILRPSGEVIEVNSTEPLLTQLKAKNIYIKSSCGGVASCADCVCKILGGVDNLSAPTFEELKLLGNVFHITKERLLCQTKISGDVTVDITDHSKVNDQEKLRAKTGGFAKQIKVRKKNEIEKIRASLPQIDDRGREIKPRPPKDQEESWFRYWEKQKELDGAQRLGGGRRPKGIMKDVEPETLEEQKERIARNRDPELRQYRMERKLREEKMKEVANQKPASRYPKPEVDFEASDRRVFKAEEDTVEPAQTNSAPRRDFRNSRKSE